MNVIWALQVSVNSIWTQHVKKELSLLKLNEDFRYVTAFTNAMFSIVLPSPKMYFPAPISQILMQNNGSRLNPQSLVQNMITGKPNVDPARMGYKVSADPEIVGMLIKTSFLWSYWADLFFPHRYAAAAELDTVIKETKRLPKEKYPEPITSSHEIGWYSRPLVSAALNTQAAIPEVRRC